LSIESIGSTEDDGNDSDAVRGDAAEGNGAVDIIGDEVVGIIEDGMVCISEVNAVGMTGVVCVYTGVC
jgi:hypothetical protein